MNSFSGTENTNSRSVFLAETGLKELTDWAWFVERSHSSIVLFARGGKMKSTAELFDELSAALQFPFYFGENWDALDECINDLEWLTSKNLVLVITETQKLLDTDYFRTLLSLLVEASSEHERNNRKLIIILQCDPSNGKLLQKYLIELAIDFANLGDIKNITGILED